MESRKVSQQTFSVFVGLLVFAFGWVQWGITSQDKRIAVTEAKAEAALESVNKLNQNLSIQLTQLQVDVQWIKLKIDELKMQPARR